MTEAEKVEEIHPDIPSHQEEDLFAGGYEEFIEKEYIATPNYPDSKILPTENFNSSIVPKRGLYKCLITRTKRNFEQPIINLFQDKNANEESSAGNNEVKGVKSANDYPMLERPYIEMGFQTANSFVSKTFQVAKKEYVNDYTQVEKGLVDVLPKFIAKKDKYLSDPNLLISIENFLNKVRPRVEQSLQSNETINIFMNDFDLDKVTRIQSDGDKKNKNEQEIRTFRDNSAGNKNKKEKCVHWIRSIKESDAFIAHSLMRNFTFDERIKVNGIPYQSQILFWNIKDVEQNSPIFAVETQSEVTSFEFNPLNCDNFACALSSGQIMFIKFKDLLGILRANANTDYNTMVKKMNIKDYYIYNISSLHESHKGRVTALKWFPPGYSINKKNQIVYSKEDEKEVGVVASLGEDGQVIVWDYKGLELGEGKSIQNDVNNYIRTIHVEINKVDSIGKIYGTGLELEIKDDKILFYVSTDEGQVYCVDMGIKNTSDNPAANVIKHYYTRYYRPVLYFEVSPFFPHIFMTVHDFHFCLWSEDRTKPIFISPNLKKSSYTCGKFSPSRPGVIYLCRSNGKIDIWDFLDESHKPSVKDSFIKETVTSINLFRYVPPVDETAEIQTKTFIEYMLVGDVSGQMTVLEVPKLFCDPASDEVNIMKAYFENEIKRQAYMEMRYKKVEEESKEVKEKKEENEAERELEIKYDEEAFMSKKRDILLELGITPPKTEEELLKEKMEKEKAEEEQ